MTKRVWLSVTAVLIAISAASLGTAAAEPVTPVPPPPPAATSSTDDLADMVLDAIQHGAPAPTTTVVPAPPR